MNHVRPMALTLALSTACLVDRAAVAQPVIVEPGWSSLRTISFAAPVAAHYNPVDGRLYAIRRGANPEGMYRIDALGFSGLLAPLADSSGLFVDPTTGNIFFTQTTGGGLYRTEPGSGATSLWVSGFQSGDDDPSGMAVAPPSYTGGVIAPGEALVMDFGFSGPDHIWIWSPATPEGEVLLHADNGTLIEAVDVTINDDSIFIVDTGDVGAAGRIFSVGVGGVLTQLTTSEPLTDPSGITFDPLTGDLLVLDHGDDRLVRINPTTGAVSVVLTGVNSNLGWSGVDVSPDGRQLIVTANEDNAIYVFGRCDAAGNPSLDCNSNNIIDQCEIVAGDAPDCNGNGVPDSCDIASGSSIDRNRDGIPDECAIAQSTFDSGTDEWTATGDIQVNVTHFPSGGNPGGHIRLDDAATGGIMYWIAPAAYLGNQSAAYGTMLEYDLRQIVTEAPDPVDTIDIRLISPGLTLVYDTPLNPPYSGEWLSYDVPLTETGWRVTALNGPMATQKQMQSVLGNLTGLHIRAEYHDGPDLDDLDNVRMGPPPPCPADTNSDGSVNVTDLLAVISAWGPNSGPADINGDGSVNVTDLLAVISAWGPCP